MRYFDTHTHIFAPQIEAVTSIFNLRIDQCNIVPDSGYFSVGIHPYDISKVDNQWIDSLQQLSIHNRCIAIGECGIDHRIDDIKRQTEIFNIHCEIAKSVRKPLIIHCVRSQGEILRASAEVGVPRIFHSYSRMNEEINKATKIIYSLSPRNFRAAAQIPLHQILLETDESDSTIEEVYHQFAKARKMSIDTVASMVEQNFFRTFAQ